MRIEYHRNGVTKIRSGKHVVESKSPLMKRIAQLLQESGRNVRHGSQTICSQTVLLNHPFDIDHGLIKSLCPVEDRTNEEEDAAEDEGDEIQIIYVDEPPMKEDLPLHLL